MASHRIGVDIENISRFKQLPFSSNQEFYKKIFTPKEIEYCLSKAEPYQHFAARFCAKEAFIKANNETITDIASIEITSNKGKPELYYKGKIFPISLSHDKDQAIAFTMFTDQPVTDLAPPNVNITLEGRTVLLKPITFNEINEKYLAWLNNPEINKYLEVRHKEQTKIDIISYINGHRQRPGCEVFAIFTKDNVHVGNVAITEDTNSHHSTIGIMIGDKGAQKLGMGGETTMLIIEYFFRNPKTIKACAGVIADNEESWKILESLGFKREGTLRNQHVLKDGSLSDDYVYGILRSEWDETRKKLAGLLSFASIRDNNE